MNHNQENDTLYRWSFTLTAELPGPCEGDAVEFIEDLGFKVSAFGKLTWMGEDSCGRTVVGQFEVIGPREVIESLRKVHDGYCRSTTPLPVPVGFSG